MYVDDETTRILIALCKAWQVRYVIASPGTQNAGFNLSVQEDPDFTVYSEVDERSAAYMATGLAFESREPVVITCTGATASRNYLSALTEAYYRRLPVIAVTYTHYVMPYNMEPQMVDRSVSQNDVKIMSVDVPTIQSGVDRAKVMFLLNAALAKACSGAGPVHINVCNPPGPMSFGTSALPADVWRPELCTLKQAEQLRRQLLTRVCAVFIGSHLPFTEREEEAISIFAESHHIPVLVDHTSNYHGKNKVLISRFASVVDSSLLPDCVIDIGYTCGEYNVSKFYAQAQIWRVSPSGDFSSRCSCCVEKLICAEEADFFTALARKADDPQPEVDYYAKLMQVESLLKEAPLPFCSPYICRAMAKLLPSPCSLHLGILNSLRCMNYCFLPKGVDVNCNVGGFGIDGPVSTLLGQSFANPDKLYFCVVGDLAFFYNMNVLGNRALRANVRILMLNNGRGEEFRLNALLENPFAEKVDALVAAAGHYASGAKAWAEACGFIYMKAENAQEFDAQIELFCQGAFSKPVFFECFTSNENEQEGMRIMRTQNMPVEQPLEQQKKNIKKSFFSRLIHSVSH